MENVLLIGPYIGDWKQEIFTFRPYARWIYEQLDHPKCYISSHFNRQFLYDWIPDENFIPVYEQLSRNEVEQDNYIHKSITIKDFKLLIKDFKQSVINKENISIKNLITYNLSYLKSTPHYSWYQKIFTKINVKPIKNDYIFYIPNKSISREDNEKITKFLLSKYDNIKLLGDNNCYDLDKCLNYQIDYIETGYINIIKYILGCKFVITPCSHWTMLCNLHHIPVFSWGDGGIYKKDGDYGFENPNNHICINNDVEIVMKAIEYFYGGRNNDV